MTAATVNPDYVWTPWSTANLNVRSASCAGTDIDGTAPNLPSGLTYSFITLDDLTDSLDFSIDGTDWSYAPTPVGGIDSAVRHIRIRPTGSFSGASGGNNAVFSIEFKVKIQ